MKKSLLLAGLVLSSMTAFAAQNLPNVTQWVESKESASQMDYFNYTYNIANLCDSSITFRIEGEYNMYVNYGNEYDEYGCQTAEYGYQRLTNKATGELNDFFTHTMRVFYTYDDLRRLIRRINYNFRSGEWERGGVYVYTYDGDTDRMTGRKLYWDEALTDLFEETIYEYNDKGQLSKESYKQEAYDQNFNPMGFVVSAYVEYVYDEDGRLILRKRSRLDPNSGKFADDGTDRLTYDENGNIVEELWYQTSPNNPTQRYTYTFTPMLRSEVAYPLNMEDDEYNLLHSTNAVDQLTMYAVDQNTGSLGVYDVYTYVYSEERPMRETVGVKENFAGSLHNDLQYVGGKVQCSGFSTYTNLNVYDMAGRVVKSATVLGSMTMDLSDLPAGVYLVAAGEKTLKIAK